MCVFCIIFTQKHPRFGTDDQRREYTRDINGYVVQSVQDMTNDGSIDKVTKYTVDAQGKVLEKLDYNRSYDTQGVATDTLTQKEVYTLDSRGNTISMTRYTGSSTTPKVIETYEVNVLGQRTKALIDNLGDGVVDRAEIYTLDANGYRTKTEFDVGNDDSINSNTTYVRDALGRNVKELLDSDNDGLPNIIYERTYDAYGKRLTQTKDNGADGSINQSSTATRNALGQSVTDYIDRTGDGLTSDDTYRINEFDEYGRLSKRTEFDPLNHSTVKEVNTYEYDSYNREILRKLDSNGDSTPDRIYETNAYDEIWNAAKKTYTVYSNWTNYQNGTPEYISHRYLNDIGQLDYTLYDYVGSSLNSGPEGSIERIVFSVYGTATRGLDGVNANVDFTTWTAEQKAPLDLERIVLSAASSHETITLDAKTTAEIARTSLLIYGQDDTVNLKGFSKLASSSKSGMDQYTANVDGTTYNIFIETGSDIDVVLS